MVQQATGAGDDDLSAVIQLLDLRVLVHAAINGDTADLGVLSKLDSSLVNLLCKLAGRSDDERAHGTQRASEQSFENGEHECGSLAGAGLSQAHEVAPFERYRDGLFLYRGGGRVACVPDSIQHTTVEFKFFEIQLEYSLTPLS